MLRHRPLEQKADKVRGRGSKAGLIFGRPMRQPHHKEAYHLLLPTYHPCTLLLTHLACRKKEVTGAQVRSNSAVCNRGLCFQSEAWRRLDMHVAVLKQASLALGVGLSSGFGAVGWGSV